MNEKIYGEEEEMKKKIEELGFPDTQKEFLKKVMEGIKEWREK